MDVVDDDHQRLVLAFLQQQLAEGPRLLRLHGRGIQGTQRRVDVAGDRLHTRIDIRVARLAQLANDVGRDAGTAEAAVRGIGRPGDQRVARDVVDQLVDETGLPDAGLAGDHDDADLPVAPHPAPQRLEERQLVVATDKRRHLSDREGVIAPADGDGLEHLDALTLALQQQRVAFEQRHPVGRQLGGERTDEHLARPRGLLQASGNVDGVPHDGGVLVATDRRHHDLAGIDADRERQVAAELAHRQPGGDGPLGIVIVGLRDAEHRHQAVAHVLVDGAAVAGDHLAHAPEGSVDDPRHGLGVGVLGQRREPDDVGEQHRGQLALVLGRDRARRWRRELARQ